jgi:c-src tyrosine kinase
LILLINDVVFLVQPLADVVKHVEKGYRMEKPEGCPQEIYKLMCQAWDLNADRRPTFHQVKQQLAQLKEMEN